MHQPLLKLLLIIVLFINYGQAETKRHFPMEPNNINNVETATLGGGCFWCLEAVYLEVKGITKVVSGFSGGNVKNPAYREVITGRTGHAEVVQLTFDPSVISYREILEIFFHLHDPTTLNRQGADVGTQYRSVIFYHNKDQEKTARQVFGEIEASGLWPNKLVTQVAPLEAFYAAEDYHQNYYARNTNQPYCTYVISPKMQKLRKLFKEKLHE
jgi:peptide-methionine (S)-S-oxide reductase